MPPRTLPSNHLRTPDSNDKALVILGVMTTVVVIELVENVFSDLVDNEGNSYGDGDLVDMLVSSLQVTLFTVVAGVEIERPAPKAA